MMNRHTSLMLFAVAVAGLTAGCYEEVGVTEYEAGIYKGESDPLLEKMATNDMQEQLAQRFQNQTDR